MLSQDRLNGGRSFSAVVEGDTAVDMMEHMRFDNVVEKMFSNETEIAVYGGCSTAGEGPAFRRVMRKGRVGMLEVSDRN